VLRLLKDKIIYLTVSAEKCYWLERPDNYEIVINEMTFMEVENSIAHRPKLKFSLEEKIDVAIESHLCRISVLPPLKKWLSKDALEYLIQQNFLQKYGTFDSSQYVLVNEKIKLNRPSIVVAYPKEIYEKIIKIKKHIKIINFVPTIFSIWNFFDGKLEGEKFLITEGKWTYLLTHVNGVIQDVDVIPSNLAQNLDADLFFTTERKNLENLSVAEIKFPEFLKKIDIYPNNQIYNLMRLYG